MKAFSLILGFVVGLGGLWLWSVRVESSQQRLLEAELSLHQAFMELPVSEIQWHELLKELEAKESLSAEERLLLASLRRLSESLQVQNLNLSKQ